MQSLPRSAVRLLPGPFLDAQATALDYLPSLDPDRLLAPLRREAGLPPVAESYGNWESSGLDGHAVGHALSGAALMSAVTDDPRPEAMVERPVQGVAECQEALGTGYVGGVPDGVRLWPRGRWSGTRSSSVAPGSPGTTCTSSSPACWTPTAIPVRTWR
ncbi:beta-L-arabinofuranosidase domain-containing protein [Streptomyces swartbergensis]|uniref:beta-L-arabinofuranosidase domain-containing protein n=1 Tax=Streptomyces swartbergensis TaxID=487165 RepID=UPI00382897FA